MSDIQEEIKIAHKRAEENDIKLLQEEIKEILDRLERIDHKEYIAFEFADIATFDEMARCFNERKKMADYITNLQERFDALLEAHKIADELETEYQERNEKAIEFIDIYTDGINLGAFDCLKLMLKIKDLLNGVDKE